MKKLLFAAGALLLATAPANATVVNVTVEGGGTPVVYQLGNGNYLGLLGFDSRPADADNIVNLAPFTFGAADITGLITSGASTVKNYYFGPSWPNALEANTLIDGDLITIDDEARLFDSLWVEWDGSSSLVFKKAFGSGTTTLGNRVTQTGVAPISSAVPEPGTWALLVIGFGMMGAALRGQARRALRLARA